MKNKRKSKTHKNIEELLTNIENDEHSSLYNN